MQLKKVQNFLEKPVGKILKYFTHFIIYYQYDLSSYDQLDFLSSELNWFCYIGSYVKTFFA